MTPTKKQRLLQYLQQYRNRLIDFMRSSECLDSQVLEVYEELDRVTDKIHKINYTVPSRVVKKYKHF